MIEKYVSDIEKLHTYFEFIGHEEWEDFAYILDIIIENKNSGYYVIRQNDYIWSRIAECVKDGTPFNLMYHEDVGVVLYNPEKQSDEYYAGLYAIAEEIDLELESRFA